MSIEINDGLGGKWGEDGTPTEDSNIQEPIQVYSDRPVRASYASLQSENAVIKRLAQAVCDEAEEPTEAIWALKAALLTAEDAKEA